MLSEEELWSRIKNLEGKTIYTIKQRRRNHILKVTDWEVIIEGRRTRPSRKYIYNVYRYLHKHGEITKDDFVKICGNEICKKVGRITMAILASALPDEVEAFTCNERGLSGIRLKKQKKDRYAG